MEKINVLGKYLITKGVNTPLKFQKLLFFLRYEEILESNIDNSFFDEKDNFEAWIYGPVNPITYEFFKNYFWKIDEKESYILDDEKMNEIDNIYGNSFQKYNSLDADELVVKSHKNKAWIDARGGIDMNTPSKVKLSENEKDILVFVE